MGKAQSKRSVDITTDTKKVIDEEITEKVEKIEDTDHEVVSAAISEQSDKNHLKKEELPVNNDKEVIVENNVEAHAGGGDSVANQNQVKSEMVGTFKENDSVNDDDASAVAAAVVEDISKKMKKEKVKKKWSFRSISFGRKDKQKPSKTEEVDDNSPTGSSNGNAADGKSLNQQNESHGIDQLVKVEEDLEKQVGNREDSDKKSADDKTSTVTTTPTLKTEEQLPEQQPSLHKDSSQTNSTNNIVKENDININVPNDIITEPEIDVTEATVTEKKTEHLQAQNSLPPIKDECKMDAADLDVDVDISLAKNSSCINGFTTDNISIETNNCQNGDAATTNIMDDNNDNNVNGAADEQGDMILENNKAAILFKSTSDDCTTTVNNSGNNSCEIITEQSKPQIEVIIPDASTISATVDNSSIASNIQSKNTQEYYHSYQDHNTKIHSLQSNNVTLDTSSNHDIVPDSIAAVVVVENNELIDADIDKANENENLCSLPQSSSLPPVPTSPPPPLDPIDYTLGQNVLSLRNNSNNKFIQNTNDNDDNVNDDYDNDDDDDESINFQQESIVSNVNDKMNDIVDGVVIENQVLSIDCHHPYSIDDEKQTFNNECKEEQKIPIIITEMSYDKDTIDDDKTQVSFMPNDEEQVYAEKKSEYENGNVNVNVNGAEYNEYNCASHFMKYENDSNIIAHNVIDELTENAIEIIDQQNVIICCNKLLEKNATTTTTITTLNDEIIVNDINDNDDMALLMRDNRIDNNVEIAMKNQSNNSTEIDYLNKNECLMQLNGINNEEKEIEQQQQLIEQFERKLCLVTETGNVDD